MPSDNIFRCDICGLTAPVDNKHRVSILAYNKCGYNTDMHQPRLNVCSKCLPNLMVMLEVAIIKTSQLMIAENGGVFG
jgi:hypothetical protein